MIVGIGWPELIITAVAVVTRLVPFVLLLVMLVLAICWFLRQEKASKDPVKAQRRVTLAEVLKAHREECHMTQEFVAEKLGVSRQAVSKWEAGKSEPSTTSLIALGELFGTDASDLMREVKREKPE